MHPIITPPLPTLLDSFTRMCILTPRIVLSCTKADAYVHYPLAVTYLDTQTFI